MRYDRSIVYTVYVIIWSYRWCGLAKTSKYVSNVLWSQVDKNIMQTRCTGSMHITRFRWLMLKSLIWARWLREHAIYIRCLRVCDALQNILGWWGDGKLVDSETVVIVYNTIVYYMYMTCVIMISIINNIIAYQCVSHTLYKYVYIDNMSAGMYIGMMVAWVAVSEV